jgi:hypothetical protein
MNHFAVIDCLLWVDFCDRGSSKDRKANGGGAGGDAPRICKVLWARYGWVTQVDGRDKLNELLSMLQNPVTEDEGKDLTSLMPLYRSVIESCAR